MMVEAHAGERGEFHALLARASRRTRTHADVITTCVVRAHALRESETSSAATRVHHQPHSAPAMRIAIVRALHLGDMLCAVPALRAVRAGHPDAHVTLVGLPWARELANLLPAYVDAFDEFPSFPGIPERPLDAARVTAFLERAQRAPWDLVVQLHGSGSHINEFIALLGARRTAGFARTGDVAPENGCFVPWPEHGTEVERLLTVPRALGCPERGSHLELPVRHEDRVAVRRLLADAGVDGAAYVCVHPGARFPSRRWPCERFAASADAVSGSGLRVVLTGTAGEAPLTHAVRHAMRTSCVDLTGRLTLGMLAAVVADATLVLCNDTGMSHVAAAVGTRSIVVASGSDVARWAPALSARHRVLWHDRPCRPCAHEICPTHHECALGVGVADVVATAERLLDTAAAHA
jgi:ADP-heptose:LPS heptosyltransferase